jgi:predicted outer membrane repeat protein
MATGLNNGFTWDDAFVSLDFALAFADDGTEIWLTAGTYYPYSYNGIDPGSPENPRLKHFSLKKGVAIIGGFIGVETDCAQRDIVLNETILSGDIGVIGDTSDNSYHVFYHPTGTNVDSTALLDGITIQDSNANGSGDHKNGGAIFNKDAAPSIKNVIFKNNVVSNYGGAIYNENISDVNINGSTFLTNKASSRGGAIYNKTSTGQISNSIFQANIGVPGNSNAAAIYNDYSDFTISSCEFNDHGVGGSDYAVMGGVILDSNGSLTIEDSIFDNNHGSSSGGVVFSNLSNLIISRCRFLTNRVGFDGGAIYAQGPSNSLTIIDSFFIGNYTTSSSNGGGALGLSNLGTVDISGTVFAKNTSTGQGGAIKVDKVSSMSASYLTFYDNRSTYAGGGNTYGGGAIFVYTQSLVNISKCIFWENLAQATNRGNNVNIGELTCTVNIENSDIEWDAFLAANNLGGNIFADPKFLDVDNDEYNLDPTTPCLDMGAFPII